MLTRQHAEEICALTTVLDSDIIVAWRDVFAPEEMFFPTVLSILGFLRDQRAIDKCASSRERLNE